MSKTPSKNAAPPPAVTAPAAPPAPAPTVPVAAAPGAAPPELPTLTALPTFRATGQNVVHPITGKRFTRDAAVPHADDDVLQSLVRRQYLIRTA
jgi:hypothetical protein